MVRAFRHELAAQRVSLGLGNLAEVAEEAARFGPGFVVASSDRDSVASRVAQLVGAGEGDRFLRAAQHTPIAVTEEALAVLGRRSPSCIVSVGGGSATGLAKALALRSGLPVVAVPTTYAGSEMTSILGQTDAARKWTLRDEAVRPRAVVYDAELTCGLPPRSSAASGLNALAHAVEAFWARDASPVLLLLAEEAVRVLTEALPAVVADGADTGARLDALYGAYLAGTCLGACEMALHHRICHVLGGRYELPHAETHAVVLPQVAALYAATAPVGPLGRALGCDPAALGPTLFDLLGRLGLPRSLTELGLPPGAVGEAVSLVVAAGGYTPVEAGPAELGALLARAATGAPPPGA